MRASTGKSAPSACGTLHSGHRVLPDPSILCAACCLLCALWGAPALGLTIPKPTFGLDFGIGGEYARSSDSGQQRKPPYAYNANLNGSLTWWFLTLGLNLMYSSDDKFTAQKINNFSFSPSWSWGKLHTLDFTPTITERTLCGVPLYGGGIELFPAKFRLTAVAGRSRRADTSRADWSYDRTVMGARLGFEQFSLVVVKAADDPRSNRIDGEVPIAPQENLVAGLSSRFQPARDWQVDIELDGSVHSRDVRSDTLYVRQIPSWVYKVFQPRWSSRADYAASGSIRYAPSFMTIGLSAGQVGPGYTALGTNGVRNDYRNGRADFSTRLIPRTNLGLYYEVGQDNIAGDKLADTKSNSAGMTLNIAPISQVSVNAGYTRGTQVKDAGSDSFSLNTLTQTLTASPNLALDIWGISQNLNLVGTYLDLRNRAAFSSTPPSRSLTIGLNYSITPRLPVTFSSGLSRTMNLSDSTARKPEWYQNYSVTFNRALFHNRVQNALTVCYQPSAQGANLCLNGGHTISITSKDAVNLNWSLSFFRSSDVLVRSFSTQRITAGYNRKIF
jgi:hypothetical protein